VKALVTLNYKLGFESQMPKRAATERKKFCYPFCNANERSNGTQF